MSNILKGLNEGYFSRDEENQQNAMNTRRSSDLSRERNAGLDEPDDTASAPVQTRNGVYEYTVPAGQESIAQELGLQQHRGHWISRMPIQRANFQFGRPQFHEIPAKGVAEGTPKDPNAPKLVQDRKTGKWYDPKKEFEKKMNSPEVQAQMKRMATKEGKEDKIAQLKKDHATAVHWSKNETSPQKREAARQKAEKIKRHLDTQYKQGVAEGSDTTTFNEFHEWKESVYNLGAEITQMGKAGQYTAMGSNGVIGEFNDRTNTGWLKGQQGVAEGVAETLPMDDAVKVLRQYGADHFKTTSNELHFYKNGRPFSVDLVMNSDATRNVTLSSLNSATRGLKGQGVAEEQLDELSNNTLASYKKKAGADATQADKRGDYARGNKRMSGIVKATKKEFDNDAKGVTEAGNKPIDRQFPLGTGDTRTPRDIKSQMRDASDKFVQQTAASKTGPFHSRVAKMQNKMAKSELRKRDDHDRLATGTNEEMSEEKQRLDPSCWKGYKKQGTKMKGDTRVNNCVPIKKESAIMKGLK
jgi:hypothetical protein